MGEIAEDVLRPLDRFYEKGTAAKQYLLLGDTSWTLVDGFRTMAVSHAAAMWLLRLTCGNRRTGIGRRFQGPKDDRPGPGVRLPAWPAASAAGGLFEPAGGTNKITGVVCAVNKINSKAVEEEFLQGTASLVRFSRSAR